METTGAVIRRCNKAHTFFRIAHGIQGQSFHGLRLSMIWVFLQQQVGCFDGWTLLAPQIMVIIGMPFLYCFAS
jgi:hypothetical protein